MNLEARLRKSRCYWCQAPSDNSVIPCCVGAMMWQAAMVRDARRWLAENNPDVIHFGFGDDGHE